ncbi:hypothetical protein [Streptomyces sp. PvR034]|uniref:hypothetical protein n=1 Tax=Streptomyces sp. PvR034 TaxID=3156401 RepID=UPI00339B5510
MGIESDHLVYEYLSRVGDLAQRRQLASADRMRLVSGLRDEIDRRRAKYDPDTPAAVRRILERIGSPEEILDALAAGRDPEPTPAPGGVPVQRGAGRLLGRKPVPPPRPAEPTAPAPAGPASPHLAGMDELGPDGGGSAEPDWWRVGPGGYGAGPQVEGFAGGIEMPDLPDLFKVPAEEDEAAEAAATGAAGTGGSRGRAAVRALRERRRRRKEAAAAAGEVVSGKPRPHAFLVLAALLLAVGVVTGYWVLLGLGWLVAYLSRVLGPTEKKWVVFGLPGVVFAGAVVWVWGRMNSHWGDPIVDGHLGEAFHGMWPWLVRGAAVASALHLTWRAHRH